MSDQKPSIVEMSDQNYVCVDFDRTMWNLKYDLRRENQMRRAMPDFSANKESPRSRVSETLADALAEDIRLGLIPFGTPLPTERELCERFDASRASVREALHVLRERGYADMSASRRPIAAKPTFERIFANAAAHIRDLVGDAESGAYIEQMRQFIEVGAVRTVIASASPLKLARIAAALAACHDAIGDRQAFAEADVAFHRAIVQVVENAIILTLHDMFVRQLLGRRPPLHDQLAHDKLVYSEHEQIFQAIVAADADRAAELLDAHLARSFRNRLAVFHEQSGKPPQA